MVTVERNEGSLPTDLVALARRHTTGQVSPRRHAASRARVLDRWTPSDVRPRQAVGGLAVALTGVGIALSLMAGAGVFVTMRSPTHHKSPVVVPGPDPLRPAAPVTMTTLQDDAESEAAAMMATDGTAATGTISVSPESAKIYWDGELLEGNPAKIKSAPDTKHHRIRAEAPGYAPKTEIVTAPSSNMSISFELERLPFELGPITSTVPIPDRDDAVESLQDRLAECYHEGLADDPTMAGSARIVLRVDQAGSVTSSEIAAAKGLSAKVTTCLAYTGTSAHFRPAGAGAVVQVPVAFRPK